jgi:hypothetical protein
MRMQEKRAAKAVEEAKEAKANELIRRKGGQDMDDIKEQLRLKEADKEARQRKQGILFLSANIAILTSCIDKIDEAKAKAAIRAQIEADKKARAERSAKEKALREVCYYFPCISR